MSTAAEAAQRLEDKQRKSILYSVGSICEALEAQSIGANTPTLSQDSRVFLSEIVFKHIEGKGHDRINYSIDVVSLRSL